MSFVSTTRRSACCESENCEPTIPEKSAGLFSPGMSPTYIQIGGVCASNDDENVWR